MRNPTVRDDLFYDRLAAWIESRRHIPFAWAANDCITCAAAWVEAATGDTPLPALLEYHTADEAAALLAERGGLERTVQRRLDVNQSAHRVQAARAGIGSLALAVKGQQIRNEWVRIRFWRARRS